MLSALFTLGIYIAGVFAPDMRDIGEFTQSPALKDATTVLYYLVPNFHNFNVIAAVAHGEAVPVALIWQNTLYAVVYVSAILIAASAVFSRRNLK